MIALILAAALARADALHEWWMVQLGLTAGMHLR